MLSIKRAETIHRMTRRRSNWDYCAPGVYMITLTLADRSRGWLGEVVCEQEWKTCEETCEQSCRYHGGSAAELARRFSLVDWLGR